MRLPFQTQGKPLTLQHTTLGGDVTPPVPFYQPNPHYSKKARQARYSGVVVVEIIVDTEGNVRDARVIKPVGLGLDEEALKAVRTWRFKPGMRSGVPVATRVGVEVFFRLK